MLGAVLCGTSAPEALPWVENILRHLRRNEPDPVWRTALAAEGHWARHLLVVAAKLGAAPDEAGEGVAPQQLGEQATADLEALARFALADRDELEADPRVAAATEAMALLGGQAAVTNQGIRGLELYFRDPLRALELARSVTRANPLDAEAHFRLGARLGQLADFDASLAELRIAIVLSPQWDRPRVELAIVLGNSGRHPEALHVLEQAAEELDQVTPWVRLHLAHALEQLDRWSEALSAYELYFKEKPRDGEALDRAAHLHLLEGDRKTGRRRAKEAAAAGIPTVLMALESGYYDGPRTVRRPAHAPGLSVHFRSYRDR